MSNDVQPVLCLDVTIDISPKNNDSENGCCNANKNTTDVCSLHKAFYLIRETALGRSEEIKSSI